MTSKAGLLRVN